MRSYVGVTIGPIYKTLRNARKTRELWAGSYIFSHIMRRIIGKFRDHEIILPQFDIDMLDDPKKRNGIGMFHDRCVFITNEDKDLGILRQVVEDILEDIGNQFGEKDYIKKYFQVSWCLIRGDGEVNEAVRKIDEALNAIELQQRFVAQEKLNKDDYDAITSKLRDAHATRFLFEDAGRKEPKFDSITRIATRDLKKIMDDYAAKESSYQSFDKFWDDYESREEKAEKAGDDIADPYNELAKKNEKVSSAKGILKKHHRYIAIVKADGDNLGAVIKGLAKKDEFKEFSRSLFEFAKKAHGAVQNYGGETIYAGGDDLLFFAPIQKGERNVFGLISDLSDLYRKTVSGETTLSFGMSVSYYKYPLYEALEAAQDLLSKAKNYPGKNAVGVRLLKHSGKFAETVFGKGSPFDTMRGLISDSLDDAPLFNSLTHTLLGQAAVLQEIGADRQRVANFIDNSFNEEIHKKNPAFMKRLADLVNLAFSSSYELAAMLKIASFMQEE